MPKGFFCRGKGWSKQLCNSMPRFSDQLWCAFLLSFHLLSNTSSGKAEEDRNEYQLVWPCWPYPGEGLEGRLMKHLRVWKSPANPAPNTLWHWCIGYVCLKKLVLFGNIPSLVIINRHPSLHVCWITGSRIHVSCREIQFKSHHLLFIYLFLGKRLFFFSLFIHYFSFILLNVLRWQWLVKLGRFQV